jgi:hypothetical protein
MIIKNLLKVLPVLVALIVIGFSNHAKASDPTYQCGTTGPGYAGSTYTYIGAGYNSSNLLYVDFHSNSNTNAFTVLFDTTNPCGGWHTWGSSYVSTIAGHNYRIEMLYNVIGAGNDGWKITDLGDGSVIQTYAIGNTWASQFDVANHFCGFQRSDNVSQAFSSPTFYCSGTPASTPLEITSPVDGALVPVSDIYTFQGTCPTNGPNQLGWTRDITQISFIPVHYEIDCIGNEWFWNGPVLGGSQQIYIVDTDTGDFAHSSFTGINDPNVQITYPNDLQIIYPTTQDSQSHYTVQPDDEFPFRFKYKLAESSDYNTAVFRMSNCTSIAFSSCTLGANFYVKNNDTRPNGNFDVLLPIDANTTYYFVATLYDSYPSPTWSRTIKFIVKGDSASTVLPDAGNTGGNCSNFLCDLFIPSSLWWDGFNEQTKSSIGQKVPFYYYYQLKNSFTGISTTATDTYFVSTTLALTSSHGTTNIPFQFLNTADSQNKSIFNSFRVYISAALWLGFAFYLMTRAFRLFKGTG